MGEQQREPSLADERFVSVKSKPTWPVLRAIAGAVLLGACASSRGPVEDVIVAHYEPSPIMVETSNSGVLHPANGCILFTYGAKRRSQAAALFPPGTRGAVDGRSLVLPNGEAIPMGTEVTVVYEAPPTPPDGWRCGLRTIRILHLQAR